MIDIFVFGLYEDNISVGVVGCSKVCSSIYYGLWAVYKHMHAMHEIFLPPVIVVDS